MEKNASRTEQRVPASRRAVRDICLVLAGKKRGAAVSGSMLKAVYQSLSDQDRTIVANVADRLEDIEEVEGPEAADAALEAILEALAFDAPPSRR